jgi:chromosome segregation ATPase
MADEGEQIPGEQSTAGKWILILAAVIAVVASGYAHYAAHSQIDKLNGDLSANKAQLAELQNRMQTAEASEETIAHQVGITKKELAQRAAELQAQQKAAEAAETRVAEEQKKQLNEVSGEVAGVKTDVGGVKSDVASTKSDLEVTKTKLQSTIGDLGMQSGLIAHTQGDLETLKHKGDKNYFEFTLMKGAKPQVISTISLQLKKTDAKHGKFTVNVTSDDKTLEKKDRNASEPIQFYSGRDHLLFELVVWNVDKNKVTGYLSTPKNAPVPVSAN